ASRQLVEQGARPDAIRQARAAVAAASANVAAARSRQDEMLVRSPSDGVVAALDLRPGDLVGPRAQVAIVNAFSDPYVRVYVVQPDLARIKVGDTLRVRSDAAPGAVLSGRVEQIDQQAQFTPRDVQTASDRADLTFGVKVRVRDPQRRLHGGTTVEVALP
ncbi:MAG: efflux RND transporter periplasmic adaptor subunit, partial [Candidatus Eremiobacteraeota bacterium]|nr:efflux RND transporter periplasmic adaptor subunit [Candidatus Eremiobacteraeota bacterium]